MFGSGLIAVYGWLVVGCWGERVSAEYWVVSSWLLSRSECCHHGGRWIDPVRCVNCEAVCCRWWWSSYRECVNDQSLLYIYTLILVSAVTAVSNRRLSRTHVSWSRWCSSVVVRSTKSSSTSSLTSSSSRVADSDRRLHRHVDRRGVFAQLVYHHRPADSAEATGLKISGDPNLVNKNVFTVNLFKIISNPNSPVEGWRANRRGGAGAVDPQWLQFKQVYLSLPSSTRRPW